MSKTSRRNTRSSRRFHPNPHTLGLATLLRPACSTVAVRFCTGPTTSIHTAAAREGGCARGCKSHPSNGTVHDGTVRCLSPRKAARGISSPDIEPMGLNEDEPQQMSLDKKYNRSRRVPGVRMKADAGSADNRQPLPSPAGSAWQARRAGQPQIKRGERSR